MENLCLFAPRKMHGSPAHKQQVMGEDSCTCKVSLPPLHMDVQIRLKELTTPTGSWDINTCSVITTTILNHKLMWFSIFLRMPRPVVSQKLTCD